MKENDAHDVNHKAEYIDLYAICEASTSTQLCGRTTLIFYRCVTHTRRNKRNEKNVIKMQ